MSAFIDTLTIYCDECDDYHPHHDARPVSQMSDVTLEARMAAQARGWRIRRGHSGRDLCPSCREAT